MSVEECVELLCAEVLRFAYIDLLDAMLADAAHRFRKYSYNCADYYIQITHSRGHYGAGSDSWKLAMRDAERLMKWFNYSDRCKLFCKRTTGAWFVGQAKRHVKEFALDQKPEWEIRPHFGTGETSLAKIAWERSRMETWKKNRDKWREEHGMGEVE